MLLLDKDLLSIVKSVIQFAYAASISGLALLAVVAEVEADLIMWNGSRCFDFTFAIIMARKDSMASVGRLFPFFSFFSTFSVMGCKV